MIATKGEYAGAEPGMDVEEWNDEVAEHFGFAAAAVRISQVDDRVQRCRLVNPFNHVEYATLSEPAVSTISEQREPEGERTDLNVAFGPERRQGVPRAREAAANELTGEGQPVEHALVEILSLARRTKSESGDLLGENRGCVEEWIFVEPRAVRRREHSHVGIFPQSFERVRQPDPCNVLVGGSPAEGARDEARQVSFELPRTSVGGGRPRRS
jgi:hypothetical protein